VSTDEIDEIERQIRALVLYLARAKARSPIPELGRLDRMAFHILGLLAQRGPLRPSAVAGAIGLDLSTVSRHLASLEAAGLVERDRDPQDGRAFLVQPTTQGTELVARIAGQRREWMERTVGHWTADDRRELARLLRRLNDDLPETYGASPVEGAASPS
jgi:DNA-binding MarR family transcriptional regulator